MGQNEQPNRIGPLIAADVSDKPGPWTQTHVRRDETQRKKKGRREVSRGRQGEQR